MNSKKKAGAAVTTLPLLSQASEASPYAELLSEVKQRIRHAQARAWMAVNAELIRLYWRIGQVIDRRQQQEGYGTAVIPRLARDLHNELPEEKGFSERNIKRMLPMRPWMQSVCHSLWHKRAPPQRTRPPCRGCTSLPHCCWPCPGATMRC